MPHLEPTEFVMILVVLILLFRAKGLPDLARGGGGAIRIFKAGMRDVHDFQSSIESEEAVTTPSRPRVEELESA